MRRVRTISRKGQEGNDPFWNPQRPYVEHLRQQQMKIWSELHGDVESWAELETAQPPSGDSDGGNRTERNSLSGKFRPARMA